MFIYANVGKVDVSVNKKYKRPGQKRKYLAGLVGLRCLEGVERPCVRIFAVFSLFFLFHAILPAAFSPVKGQESSGVEIDWSDEIEEDENSDLNLKFFSPPLAEAIPSAVLFLSPAADTTNAGIVEDIPTPPPL